MRAEAGVSGVVPLHGSAFAVAADFLGPSGAAFRIFYVLLALGIVVFHPDLFAVVHDGAATEREIQRRHQLCNLVLVCFVPITVHIPGNVVIAEHVHRPSVYGIAFYRSHFVAKCLGIELVYSGEVEVHRHLQFIVAWPVVLGYSSGVFVQVSPMSTRPGNSSATLRSFCSSAWTSDML